MKLIIPQKLKDSFISSPAYNEWRNGDFYYSSSYSSSFLKTGLILSGRIRVWAKSCYWSFCWLVRGYTATAVVSRLGDEKSKRQQASTKLFRPGNHSWELNLWVTLPNYNIEIFLHGTMLDGLFSTTVTPFWQHLPIHGLLSS